MIMEEFDGKCERCGQELDLPLYCKECKIWLCSNCHLSHDVEIMKERGLLLCPCGEDHDYNQTIEYECNKCGKTHKTTVRRECFYDDMFNDEQNRTDEDRKI